MPDHQTHESHSHQHSPGCGHQAIQHGDHVDYIHDAHLHRAHGNHVDECTIPSGRENPASCTPSHACSGHALGHQHGPDCGHPRVPHGDHVDFLVDSHLHHAHGAHCDDHGGVVLG